MRLAVIPARGGSKRIPRKNIREFAGKPMIAYSIECARRSGSFDRVLVSTDSEEIAAVARDCGAEVPFLRPATLSDDHTGITPVMAHAIRWLQANGSNPTSVCCIYATAPFVSEVDVCRGLELLESGTWKYVVSASTFGAPVFRGFRCNPAGGLEMLFPEHFLTRSQDLPEVLHDAGQFCWGRTQPWLEGARIFDSGSTFVPIPRWRVQDIDTEEDWRRAEWMAVALAREQDHANR